MAPRTSKDPAAKPATPAKTDKTDKAVKAAKPRAVKASAKPAPKAAEAKATPEPKAVALKLKDLIDAVATATGSKKPEAKKAVEATLAVLGEALATGKALAVPPLGKLRVVRANGPALTLKLRRGAGPQASGLALAEDGEDS